MMKLYCSRISPYSRKVRVAIEELRLSEQVEEIETEPNSPPPEFLAANPLARVPTLITDKGEALPDSDLIIEYLDAKYHGLAPLPRGTKRWTARRRQKIAQGVIDAAVATVQEKRRPESIVYHAYLDRQLAAIRRSLELLNLEANTLLLDEKPSVVEITTGVGLAYLDFRMPYLEWRKEFAALDRWFGEFARRPSMVKTQPPA
ncbi:glutathione S-transferase family protein [Solimonas sp. K1W22B-7]|uniref:glutathione S-transferase family protein n=1 Tax=Solimonas sp. K1W22B-7 TaxID=2303331 RepID=UPI000E32FF7F|nr:glutathione S-transferase family protein [Solimonas sp. K1W22B-7]AXQ29057.1 glutathione S-transferase family protein [Solimonas sp. K1W22B-7]